MWSPAERFVFLFAAEEKDGKRSRQKGDFVFPLLEIPLKRHRKGWASAPPLQGQPPRIAPAGAERARGERARVRATTQGRPYGKDIYHHK